MTNPATLRDWEKEFDKEFKGNPIFEKWSITALKSFIRTLQANQKRAHAIEMAAVKSNHDQLKTYYEGKLVEQQRAMVENIENYFKGLIFIPDAQITKKNLISIIKE